MGRPYDSSSDVWSVGVLAYELMTLQKPFTASSLPQLIMRITRGEYEPMPSTLPYSAALRDVIGRCMQLDPVTRPTVAELLALPLFKEEERAYLDRARYSSRQNSHHDRFGDPSPPASTRRGRGSSSQPSVRTSEIEQDGVSGSTRERMASDRDREGSTRTNASLGGGSTRTTSARRGLRSPETETETQQRRSHRAALPWRSPSEDGGSSGQHR